VAEAVECLGGNCYVEESILPRLFRESPLNSIWEGSGNVIALDVLRVIEREPDAVEVFVDELRAGSADERLAAYVESAISEFTGAEPASGRRIAERLALALQGSLLSRYGSQSVADAFVATRLDGDWGRSLGTLPPYAPLAEIVARGWPEAA
jgi:putative acyl-CoA dehydrogenase